MRETFKELQVLMRGDASATVLRVHGEIDLATVGVFRESLRGAIATGQGDVELDLSPTRFCDSVGLCALAEAHRILDTAGRVLRVIAASPPIRRLLDLTGMAALLQLPAAPVTARPGWSV